MIQELLSCLVKTACFFECLVKTACFLLLRKDLLLSKLALAFQGTCERLVHTEDFWPLNFLY